MNSNKIIFDVSEEQKKMNVCYSCKNYELHKISQGVRDMLGIDDYLSDNCNKYNKKCKFCFDICIRFKIDNLKNKLNKIQNNE